jgi:hypothetical protein
MAKDILRYDKMIESAMRGVVRQAISEAAKHGLPGAHHFYISFRTDHPGTTVPDYLKSRYPQEMTIVLQYQFWGLDVEEESFSVTLSFNNVHERLTVPFQAVTVFADPAAKFTLPFQARRLSPTRRRSRPPTSRQPRVPRSSRSTPSARSSRFVFSRSSRCPVRTPTPRTRPIRRCSRSPRATRAGERSPIAAPPRSLSATAIF